METIYRSYKFKLRPTQKQKILLDKHFGCVRYVYNYFLNERKEQYQANKKADTYYKQCLILTKLKKEEKTIWLKEVNSQMLQSTLRNLDTAYLNFFRGNTKYPIFKSKKRNCSFTAPQYTKLNNNKIYAPKFKEGIKYIIDRKIKGTINKMTFSKTPTEKYFVSILVTEEQYQPSKKTKLVCGIDLGLKHLIVTSDKTKFKNHKYTKKYETTLAKTQKHFSRKQKGSNSSEKQRLKVAKIHEKIANSRKDNLHKITTKLIRNYDIICLESLDVKKMMSNSNLAKHIADASWRTIVKFLEYKADWNEKQIIKINRFYPSSKTCYKCGWINQNLKLSMRKWTCKNGHYLDRDLNASINILKEGLKTIGMGLSDYTGGEIVRLDSKQISMKPAA